MNQGDVQNNVIEVFNIDSQVFCCWNYIASFNHSLGSLELFITYLDGLLDLWKSGLPYLGSVYLVTEREKCLNRINLVMFTSSCQ